MSLKAAIGIVALTSLAAPDLFAQEASYGDAIAGAERAAAAAVADAIPALADAELTYKLGIPRPLVVGIPGDGRTLVVVVGENRLKARRDLRPGIYMVKISEDGLPHVTRNGAALDFTVVPPEERFQYAIGNFDVEWMCEKAPDIIKGYCTTFVWCATANLFC